MSDKGNLSSSENTSQLEKRLTEKAAKAKPTQVALPRLQCPQGRYKRAENAKTGTDVICWLVFQKWDPKLEDWGPPW